VSASAATAEYSARERRWTLSTTTKGPAGATTTVSPNGAIASFESRRQRVGRRGRRARMYVSAFAFIAVLALLVVLISSNVRSVELDWVFGSTQASLVWVILAATLLGWLLGIATGALFRHRTKA
jgi:uncharacterized integral membrane protein